MHTRPRPEPTAAGRTLALALLAAAGAAPAQGPAADDPVPDPTRTSPLLRDALKSRAADLRAIELRGLVVAAGGCGVALVGTREGGTVQVRSNSQFSVTVAGLPLKAVVRDVTPAGVEIETPTLSDTLLLPGAFGPPRTPAPGAPGTLRHVEFREVPLADALRMLAEQSGTNYAASAEAGRAVVSSFLRDVPAHTAIEEICKAHDLWYRQDAQSGILRVMTMAEFERDLVSFRDEESEVFTLLYPNVLEVASVIRSLYGDRVVLTLGNEEITDESRDLARRFQRFDMINGRAGGSFSGTGSGMSGGYGGYGGYGVSSGYGGYGGFGGYGDYGSDGYGGYGTSGGGTTVMSGNGDLAWSSDRGFVGGVGANARNGPRNLTPDQAREVQRLMAAPRTSTSDTEAALEAYGQRPAGIYVTISRRNNMVIVRSSDPKAMEDIRALVRRLDVPTSLVLLEVKVLSLDLGDGFSSMFDYQFNANVRSGGGAALTTAGFSQGEILPPASGTMTPGGVAVRSGDMTFQIVNEYFRARMQLLEEKNRVTVLATPLLLTANNEVSRLFIGEERPLVRNISSQTILTENNVATAPNTTVEFRSVGITLLITANINSDRTVTLRLVQENSAINSAGASIPVVLSGGAVQNVNVDTVSSRVISGTFAAKDNMAVAVGGLIEEQKSDLRAQVPLIGRIPILGFFFRRQTATTSRRELVILVRPRILNTPSEGGEISRRLLEEISLHPAARGFPADLGTFRDATTRPPEATAQ